MNEDITLPDKDYHVVDRATHYYREWLAEERVLCYRFLDLKKATVDHWADNFIFEFTGWPVDKPWRLMLDIRLRGSIINTYALRRAREIARLRPELPGRLAVLVGSKLAADVITMAIRANNNTYRQRQIFTSEAVAVHWLIERQHV